MNAMLYREFRREDRPLLVAVERAERFLHSLRRLGYRHAPAMKPPIEGEFVLRMMENNAGFCVQVHPRPCQWDEIQEAAA